MNSLFNLNLKDNDKLRYEKKFIIREMTLQEIENLIRTHRKVFSQKFSRRQVNNIYLDSVDLKNFNDNLGGHSERIKIRIRWYGNTFGKINNPALELKIKNHELGTKQTYKLKAFNFKHNSSIKELLLIVFKESDLPKWLKERLKLMHPFLINSYMRKYFQTHDKKFRITVDNELKYYRTDNRKILHRKPLFDDISVIMEIKYSQNEEDIAHKISQHFPFRLVASSKYISGLKMHKI